MTMKWDSRLDREIADFSITSVIRVHHRVQEALSREDVTAKGRRANMRR
jgi:hypothetical protein